MILHFRQLGYNLHKLEIRVLDRLVHRLPKRWINHLTCGNLGRLTTEDERLHTREVPTITVEEIMGAIKVDEQR